MGTSFGRSPWFVPGMGSSKYCILFPRLKSAHAQCIPIASEEDILEVNSSLVRRRVNASEGSYEPTRKPASNDHFRRVQEFCGALGGGTLL